MAEALGHEMEVVHAETVFESSVSDEPWPVECFSFGFYEHVTADIMSEILKKCPDMRAVHLLRRPTDTVASAYAYEAMTPREPEANWAGMTGVAARFAPFSDGVKFYCQSTSTSWLNDMVAVHEYLENHSFPDVMEIRFEDYEADYDATTRRFYEHFLGNMALVDELVIKAQSSDLSRVPENASAPEHVLTPETKIPGTDIEMDHISSKDDESEVLAEMGKQLEAGDPCAESVFHMDVLLGY